MRTCLLIIALTCALFTLGQSVYAKKPNWISLFNGKDLTGWHFRNPAGRNGWKIQDGIYVNTPPSTDIQTDSEYYDFQLHVEFNVSSGNGNSGVYLRDRYEVQIFNSYGKPPIDTGCGALYHRIAPAVNASKPPGEWQTFDITFIGKRLIVIHNGQKVLDVVDVGPMGTGASSNRPDAPGPLRLQGDHDAVSFRNIRIRPLSKSEAEKLIKGVTIDTCDDQRTMNRRIRLITPAIALVVLCFYSSAVLAAPDQLFHESRPAMGTSFEVYLYAPDRERAYELFEAVFDEIERVEEALSNYRSSSELSRINASGVDAPVVTDPEVFALLERSFDYSRQSDGAFDVTVGKLMKAWGFFRGAGRYPSNEELARARAQTGWQRVKLDQRARSVFFLTRGIELDLGGIGKGYALDCVARMLREAGVTAALINSGSSSIYAIGAPPGNTGWPVRVYDPVDRTRILSTILLKDQSLSTSGSYEKFFKLNGRTYCHIMDPRTGRPVEGMLQTTIIAPEATDSDALSTAVFVMGPERSSRLLDNIAGTSATFVSDRKGVGRIVQIRWPDHQVGGASN